MSFYINIYLGNAVNAILKTNINQNQTFFDFVQNIHESTSNTIANEIYDTLTLENNGSSLFISLTYSKLKEELYSVSNSHKSDLHFEVVSSLCKFNLEFNVNLLSSSFAKSILSHYLFLLKQVIKNPNIKISDFEMVMPEEHKLLEKFNKSVNFDAKYFSGFDIKDEKPCFYIFDDNMKQVPIFSTRRYFY